MTNPGVPQRHQGQSDTGGSFRCRELHPHWYALPLPRRDPICRLNPTRCRPSWLCSDRNECNSTEYRTEIRPRSGIGVCFSLPSPLLAHDDTHSLYVRSSWSWMMPTSTLKIASGTVSSRFVASLFWLFLLMIECRQNLCTADVPEWAEETVHPHLAARLEWQSSAVFILNKAILVSCVVSR